MTRKQTGKAPRIKIQSSLLTNCARNEPKRPETSQNDSKHQPKRAETSQNDSKHQPKRPETSRNDKKKLRNNLQRPKISKLGKSVISYWLLFFQTSKFGYFGSISINFLIITKYYRQPISKVLVSNLTLVFEIFESKRPNLGILGQKVASF